jgi:hypothetical protein
MASLTWSNGDLGPAQLTPSQAAAITGVRGRWCRAERQCHQASPDIFDEQRTLG